MTTDATMRHLSGDALALLLEAAKLEDDTATADRVRAEQERREPTTYEWRHPELRAIARTEQAEPAGQALGRVLADARNKAEALQHDMALTRVEQDVAAAVRALATDALERVDALLLSLRVNP